VSEIIITVDPHVFRLSAVKKAAYRLGDRCFARIEVLSEGGIQVTLTAKSEKVSLHALEGDFRNELLDQDLRESIADETERVRNLLLAQAFSGLSLTDSVADTADYRDDPLGIGQSQTVKH
jgi:His-Xaa-Ser system protein HxsD